MFDRKNALTPSREIRDPFAMLRQLTSEFDRMVQEWPAFRVPALHRRGGDAGWSPRIDVFERDKRLITRVDLPGMKKEDVSVELADGCLTLTGERRHEVEEKKEDFYRREREYGSFCRTVPLPDGVKIDDVTATFADGVLEVSVPMPATPELTARKVPIGSPVEAPKAVAKAAGAGVAVGA